MIMNPSGPALPFIRHEKEAEPEPSVAVQLMPEPQEQAEETAETRDPEPAPSQSPTPPSATPFTPTPDPYGVVLNTGMIESGKPWLINIHADWTAVTAPDNQAEITVVVYVDHYALSYSSAESLNIRLGEDAVLLSANDINSDVNRPQSTEIGRKTFSVPLPKGETVSLPLAVSWNFTGKYVDDAGHYFDIRGISCEGTVTITG